MSDRASWQALVYSNVGHSFAHIFMLLYPTVVLALEPEMSLDYDALLALALPGAILFGAGALPAGWLGDRWSAPGMMVIFFLATGAAAVLTGFATTPTQIMLGLAAIGLAASIYHPVGIAWLVQSAKNRGKTLGINGIFGSLGTASAALIAGTLSDLISWRAAFIVPGAISLLIGIAMFATTRGLARAEAGRPDRAPEAEPSRADVLRTFIVLSVTMICVGLIYQATSVSLPKVFATRLGEGRGAMAAGATVSAIYLVGGLSILIGGHLADRYPLRFVYAVFFALQVPFLLLTAQLAGPAVVGAAMMAVVFNNMLVPAESSLLAKYTPSRWRGTAFGAKFVLSLGVAAFGIPLVSLVYAQTGGLAWLYIILALLAALGFLAAQFLPGDSAPARAPAPAGADD